MTKKQIAEPIPSNVRPLGCRRSEDRDGNSNGRRKRPRKYDAIATKKIIAEYGHIVKFIAYKLANNLPASLGVEDLINVGLVGLMDAAERFDEKLGYKFTTFAEFRIRGAMLDELRKLDWMPRGARERAKEYQKVCEELRKENGRGPSTKEISKVMGLSEKKVAELESNGTTIVHFEDINNFDSENENSEGELINEGDTNPYEFTNQKNIRSLMEQVIHDLPERDQAILVMYYFEELSLSEIGSKLQITESRVSQIHSRAIIRLKELVKEKEEYSELKTLLA